MKAYRASLRNFPIRQVESVLPLASLPFLEGLVVIDCRSNTTSVFEKPHVAAVGRDAVVRDLRGVVEEALEGVLVPQYAAGGQSMTVEIM